MAKKKKEQKYYEAIGRKKEATARTRLYIVSGKKEITVADKPLKNGEILVNGVSFDSYFPGEIEKIKLLRPLALTNSKDRFAISIQTRRGGKTGQLEASVLSIARALVTADPEYRTLLKKAGLLTRDARERERRKVGTGGKARRKKQSPK